MQWKNGEELQRHLAKHRELLGEELCDVLYWVLVMTADHGIGSAPSISRQDQEERGEVSRAQGSWQSGEVHRTLNWRSVCGRD